MSNAHIMLANFIENKSAASNFMPH